MDAHFYIRPEQPEDFTSIGKVLATAFGRGNESHLVDAIRRSAEYVPELTLVAVDERTGGGGVIGHVMLSGVLITREREDFEALALAPLAVHPDHQRRGVGTSLVNAALQRAASLLYGRVIVLGHPEYYGRFGFEPASRRNIRAPFEVPDEAFMALALRPNAFERIADGTVRYPESFAEV